MRCRYRMFLFMKPSEKLNQIGLIPWRRCHRRYRKGMSSSSELRKAIFYEALVGIRYVAPSSSIQVFLIRNNLTDWRSWELQPHKRFTNKYHFIIVKSLCVSRILPCTEDFLLGVILSCHVLGMMHEELMYAIRNNQPQRNELRSDASVTMPLSDMLLIHVSEKRNNVTDVR